MKSFFSACIESKQACNIQINSFFRRNNQGHFYRHELSPTNKNIFDNKNIYAVEKVLNEEQRKDGKYLLVKLKGYPESQNEWIKAQQFVSIRQAS